MRDRFVMPDGEPAWLDRRRPRRLRRRVRAQRLRRSLNRYRNVQRDWEDLQAIARRPIEVPALFVGGDRTGPRCGGAATIERFPDTVPNLRGVHVLAGCGHWTQQERAAEVDALLAGFLGGL